MPTILIIEDEEANMRFATELLKMNGYDVLQAWNGKEGIELAKKESPALILMDVEMPEMDGLEALRRLKSLEKTKNIKIIVLTGRAMIGDEAKIRATGADHYLSKPYKYQDLLEAVKTYCS